MALRTTGRDGRLWVYVLGSLMLVLGGALIMQWMMHRAFRVPSVFVSITKHADRPRPLKELLDDAEGIEIDESAIQVGEIQGWGRTFTYIWRMDAAPGVFERMQERWGLDRVQDPQRKMLAGNKAAFGDATTPDWWSPHDDGSTSFYEAGPPFSRGESIEELYVAFDEKRNSIWVYWWMDF